MDDLDLKRKKIELLQARLQKEMELPHLYKYKEYVWSRDFINSRNKICCLTAANQIGKSSVQIRKMIHWATSPDLWPELWPEFMSSGSTPTQYWYLYPSKDVATTEFYEKWQEFLPQGDMKNNPVYGWRARIMNRHIWSIEFNSGVTIYFKTYAQDAQKLQSGTVAYVGCDEELPMELYDELVFRVSASNGYMSFVFTATMGQEFWREVVEDKTRLPQSDVWQVSLYDCMKYEDGSDTKWTKEIIEDRKSKCKSEAEILRRIYGRFVRDSGLKYATFHPKKHMIDERDVPFEWLRYVGIDIGSGGKTGHPSAITFIAVKPDFSRGYVYDHWRGDKIVTTAKDVLDKYLEMRGEQNITACYYDWACKDFGTICERAGIPVTKAEKSHEKGEHVLGSLLKFNMLHIFRSDETEKLKNEFLTLSEETPKRKARDDSIDSLRYGVTLINWDWSKMVPQPEVPEPELPTSEQIRRGDYDDPRFPRKEEIDQEFEFWQAQIDGFEDEYF